MHKKMTQAQFIENLAELCDGKDFPKDLLKVILQHTGGSHTISISISQHWENVVNLGTHVFSCVTNLLQPSGCTHFNNQDLWSS